MANPLNKWLLGTLVAGSLAFTGAQLWEGEKTYPYKDIVGVLTVCYGYTGAGIEQRRYSSGECNSLLAEELLIHARHVLRCTKVPLKEHQFHAFTLFTYNVGGNAFCSSNTVLVPLNRGEYELACQGMLKWVYANKKYVQGLANRRKYEYEMCMGWMNGKQNPDLPPNSGN